MNKIQQELKKKSDPKRAKNLQWFFKTGPGQYGEGDIFIGVTMPEIRKIVLNYYSNYTFSEISSLIYSQIHEERMAGFLVILEKYKKSKSKKEKRQLISYLLKNRKQLNNWDLVDVIIPKTLGDFLLDKNRKTLYRLAKSKNLWEKRISIVATFAFINKNQLEDTIKISKIHLDDEHDLMHKAVGWALRELGKKDINLLKKFLKENYEKIPRTTLRYSIERFPEEERRAFLKKTF
jgi:3-methyladenine DNA glycosylase AlkD